MDDMPNFSDAKLLWLLEDGDFNGDNTPNFTDDELLWLLAQ